MNARPPPNINDFDLERLKLHVSQARKHLQAIERLLPGMEPLLDEDREFMPKIVDEEMAEAIGPLLDVMELVPEKFEVLGLDPFVWGPELEGFSVALVRELLEVWRTLRPLEQDLGRFSQLATDYLLWVGAPVRNPVGTSVPDRAVGLAERDPRIRKVLGKSFEYWENWAPRRMSKRIAERTAGRNAKT